jgi:hypothetical protein
MMLKISKGEWSKDKYGSLQSSKSGCLSHAIPVYGVALTKSDESEANRDLLFEAGQVANETGLTPRELLELLQETYTRLVFADQHIKHFEAGLYNPVRDTTIKKVGKAIANAEKPNAD